MREREREKEKWREGMVRMSENERVSENRTRDTEEENSRVVSRTGWWDGESEV